MTDIAIDAFPPATPTVPALETRRLTKRYGSLAAVDDVDLVVPRGAVFGLIGPNGAGKSTLMSMAASLLLPTSGQLSVLGFDPLLEPLEVRSRIGYMPDGLGVYDAMSVAEYLEFFAGAYGIPRADRPQLTENLLELVELRVKHDAQVNSLSRGMKQRLSLARALVHDPELLILDEPASGLDPRARVELRELISQLTDLGKTIIVSSHILSELQEICTYVGIVEAGRLLAAGSPREILERLGGGRRVEVRFASGEREEFAVADEAAQVELLRKMVLDGRDVVEFSEVSSGLEAVFMSVTKGIVQ